MTMTKSEQIGFTRLVFGQLMQMDETKLQRGLNRRQSLLAMSRAGVVMATPRVEWLNTTANRVLGVLAEMAESFNEANPDDMISLQDFIDVLAGTARILKKKAGNE